MLGLKNGLAIISFSCLMLGATFFTKPDVALAGSLKENCDDFTHLEEEGRYIFVATCEDKNGEPQDSEIAISEYIANYKGNLSWATPPGNFHKSCNKDTIDVDDDGLLSADCLINPEGPYLGSELDLNERISVNAEGDLVYTEVRDCFSIPGPPSVPVCK